MPGGVLWGVADARTNFKNGASGNTATPIFQFETANVDNANDISLTYGRNNSFGAEIILAKHRTEAIKQAEKEGLDKIFKEAGFEWRESGCSMCLAMNADKLKPGERCASTSNRNFEGRQGKGGRTHLVSPIMAAAAAISGHLTDVRQFI